MLFPHGRCLSLAALLIVSASGARPESAPVLTSAQIVEQMQLHDQARTRALKRYHSLRQYAVTYHGFPSDGAANMVVEVDFDAASGKSFHIVSQSGSKLLLEKVLKRAIDSEKEAFQQRQSTALTPENYRFRLLGTDTVAGRSAYILDVQPLVPSKFLYRGKVWLDAEDFAALKMETEPARSPSFWISRTQIHYVGSKTDGFWMPQKVVSETRVRIGGNAVLSIDYGTYRIEAGKQD